MASFLAKIGCKRLRKRKKKKFIVPFRSDPTSYKKFQKNTKKTPKTIKYHYGIISSQRRLEKAEKERK